MVQSITKAFGQLMVRTYVTHTVVVVVVAVVVAAAAVIATGTYVHMIRRKPRVIRANKEMTGCIKPDAS